MLTINSSLAESTTATTSIATTPVPVEGATSHIVITATEVDIASEDEDDGSTLPSSSSIQPPCPSMSCPPPSWMVPCPDDKVRLTIVHVTDVYTLDNFASLKTMLRQIRSTRTSSPSCRPNDKDGGDVVVSILTGDFLAPYLLSSIDDGDGMMMAINETPIDYLTWGNHEADIRHSKVCQHIRIYNGTIINSNMQSHDTMKFPNSVPYEIIELKCSRDDDNNGQQHHQSYKVGFVATLSNDPKLYSHFKKPPFGGATIDDPYTTFTYYKELLETEHGCDIVVPLEHMYVPENIKTVEIHKDDDVSMPLILAGHDHHRVDEMIHNTRLIKPGQDAVTAAVIEIVFDTSGDDDDDDDHDGSSRSSSRRRRRRHKPTITSTFVETNNFPPCPDLKAKCEAAYNVLRPLRNTMLAGVLPQFFPLTSKDARGSVTTMGKLICSMLKEALRQSFYATDRQDAASSSIDDENSSRSSSRSSDDDDHRVSSSSPNANMKVDAVILMGGNIRGNEDYPDGSFFNLHMLEAEIKYDEVVGFVNMPGRVLAAGIEATHSGDPIPGWFQYDDGITQDPQTNKVLTVAGKRIDPDRVYCVATKIKDLTNGQSPPLTAYYTAHPDLLPLKGQYVNIHSELMKFFARGMFRELWKSTSNHIPPEVIDAATSTVGEKVDPSETDYKTRGGHDVSSRRSRSQSVPASKPSSAAGGGGDGRHRRTESEIRLSALDRDKNGYLSVGDIHDGLKEYLGLPIDDGQYQTLAEHVHACADVTNTGVVDVNDFNMICQDGFPPELQLSPKWDDVFPGPVSQLDDDES